MAQKIDYIKEKLKFIGVAVLFGFIFGVLVGFAKQLILYFGTYV